MTSLLIVVPTLDSYKDLKRLVDSLLAQTSQDWKVIFVDGDSSTVHRLYLETLCRYHANFQWEKEESIGNGIYGAMNQVFEKDLDPNTWILFWGSDDMAASSDAISRIVQKIDHLKGGNSEPDLYVCSGQYYSLNSHGNGKADVILGRRSYFRMGRSLLTALFTGNTPAHQATLFGPRVRRLLNRYDCKYKLAADLDYFLRLGHKNDIQVFVDDLNLVLIGDSGVSAKQNKRRFREVYSIYKSYFGWVWIVPFGLRYLRRLNESIRGIFNV